MKRKTKHARRKRHWEYMRQVKMQPCLLQHLGDCEGVIEADHAGDRAGFRRADDDTCVPLCRHHHWERTNNDGYFRDMTKEERREWRRNAIDATRVRYEEQGGIEF